MYTYISVATQWMKLAKNILAIAGSFYTSSLVHHFKFKSTPKAVIHMKFSIFVIKMAFYQTDIFEREVNISNCISTLKIFFLKYAFSIC